jgi:serine/threonine-protein kinase
MAADADRHLLFGLIALQVGLIDQAQLVAAFQAWARDKARPLADLLAARGDMDADGRAAVEAMVALHLKRHGDDPEKSLAAIPAGRSTRERLAGLGDAELTGGVARVGSEPAEPDHDRTTTYAVGAATADGQRFRVLRPHAKGGLGAVFVAMDAELHREVALKEILDGHADDPVSRQRFLLEAEITGGLEHPGIVPVYGLGSYADGRPYYAMRFIRGDSLKEAIAAFHADDAPRKDAGRRSLELRKLLRRFLDVCNAIEYAHGRGVLHRDLKPGNVIVGRHGETLVVDWGLAKASGKADLDAAGERPLVPSSASGTAQTLPGAAIGTPAYMSPEQARGDREILGPASDVYSLGATLYCLLTGKPPFEGDDVGALLRAVQRGEFRAPRQLDPAIDRALEAVCLKAMALRPEDRYPRARALAEDVERWMADEPVSCWREPASRRAARWARRHRPLVAGAAMLLVSAVAALSVGAVLINRERAKAEANFRQARAAVDEYFTTVSESKLLNVPGLQPLRKELLDAARRYYFGFLRERGGDPSVRAEAASASFRVGWIDLIIGQPAEALEPLRSATAAYEDLARARPREAEFRRLAATGHGALGLLFSRLERGDEAMAEHRRALAIREALATNLPGDVLARSDLARSHRNIGDLHRQVGKTAEALAEWELAGSIQRDLLTRPIPRGSGRANLTGRSDPSAIIREDLAGLLLDRASVLRELGRLDEAQAAWREASNLLEGLAREQPANQGLRARLAAGYLDQGLLLIDGGRPDEALTSLRRGLEIVERLAAANPTVTQYRVMLAEHMKLGWLLKLLGQTQEALAANARAVEVAEGLVADEPGAAQFRNLLAQALTQSGNVLLAAGRPDEALPKLRRALEIQEALARAQPESISYNSVLATALRGVGRAEAAAGRPAEARAAFERASELDHALAAKYPGSAYNLACSLALMIPVSPPAGREALAGRALDALRQARASGYANLASMKADTDLDALRDRPDFRNVLLDMAVPADPFAARD